MNLICTKHIKKVGTFPTFLICPIFGQTSFCLAAKLFLHFETSGLFNKKIVPSQFFRLLPDRQLSPPFSFSVKSTSILSLTTVKGGRIDISVSDLTGKVVSKQSVVVIAGNNPVTMNFEAFGAGTYIITAVNAEGELKTIRFVKF